MDGEREFKNAMTRINAEFRTMNSELALAEAEFKGQANSLEFLSKKQDILTQKYKAQVGVIAALEAAVDDATEAYGRADTRTQKYQQQLNRAKTELIGMENALEENGRYLKEAQDSIDGAAHSIDEYGNKLEEAGDASERFGEDSEDAIGQLSRALSSAGAAKAVKEIADALRDCAAASIEFESAMAGVTKVTKGTDEEMAAMAEGIKQMSTEIPATTTEIAAVAEAAARLGIAQEDILAFSRVMLDLGESSNLSADEAATALARFANIAGTSSADYERLGSVIVALGNNFATSESEITAMASKLASAGTLAGLSESQIMALSAAMSSVGIEAEAGGTAMTQTLTAIEKAVSSGGAKLELFAEISGTSAESFANAWQTDAMGAVQAFISGLGDLDEQGKSATEVLDDLGLSGIRQSNMLKSLALAADTLAGTVELAGQAWEENSALAETAAARYETTESKMTMMANAANNVKIAIGDALAPALGDLAESGTSVLSWAAEILEKYPALVSAFTGVTTALGVLTAGVAIHNIVIPAATAAMTAFNLVLTANPAIGVAAAITGVVAALGALIAKLRSAKAETEEFAKAESHSGDEGEKAAAQTDELAASLENLAGASLEETTSAVEELASSYEDMTESTRSLISETDLLKTALDEQAESGSVSLDTALKLIEAGYSAAVAIDTETGAVTLNKDEYVRLAKAKLDDQIASLEVQRQSAKNAVLLAVEANEAYNAGSAYWEAAKGKAAMESNGDVAALEAQIAALQRLRESIGSYSGAASSAAGTASRAASSAAKAAAKVKTQAEQDLESYKSMTAELDHMRNMDALSERDYYDALASYRDQFLTDEANVEEYRKVTEQIYQYDKSLGEQEAALWSEQTDALIDELRERYDSIIREQEKMEEKLASYGDLFSVDKKTGVMTVEDLQKQIDAENAYADALGGVRDRGISDSLMDEILGMDVDSATQYSEQLLSMTDKEWDKYNALWDEKQRRATEISEDFFKDEIDALETEYNDKLGDSMKELVNTAFNGGKDMAQGIIEGLQAQEGVLYAQAEQMMQHVSAILSSASVDMGATFSTANLRPQGGVTAQDVQSAASNVINGMGTLMTGYGSGDLRITIPINGRELAQATVPDFRAVMRANPEVKDDR